jgi:phosphoribosylamine--glycine ligase
MATVCKYVVPAGYGVNPKVGAELDFDEKAIERKGALLYYAAVNEEGSKILTTTSRSAGIVGFGESIVEAERMSETALKHVKGEFFVRHDIGKIANIKSRTDRMKSLRKSDDIGDIMN